MLLGYEVRDVKYPKKKKKSCFPYPEKVQNTKHHRTGVNKMK